MTRILTSPLTWLITAMVWVYRGTLGLFMSGHCKFHPTCSQYMLDAVHKHGPIRGCWQGCKRLCRCHPFSKGGHDPA